MANPNEADRTGNQPNSQKIKFPQGFAHGQVYHTLKTVFDYLEDPSEREHRQNRTKIHIMKTTRIASLFAAAMSILLTATASAVPASKRIGPSKTSASGHTTSTPVVHKAMRYVSPPGKGYVCNR